MKKQKKPPVTLTEEQRQEQIRELERVFPPNQPAPERHETKRIDSDELWRMATEITDKQKSASALGSKAAVIDWADVESTWYDWLCEKILTEPIEE